MNKLTGGKQTHRNFLVRDYRIVYDVTPYQEKMFSAHYFYFSQQKLTTHYRRCQMKKNIKDINKNKMFFKLMRHRVTRKTCSEQMLFLTRPLF